MYSGSASFNTANEAAIQKHRVRGTIGSTAFASENVLDGSMTIVKKNSDGSDIKVGAVYISEFKCTFLKNVGILPRGWLGKIITVEFGLCVSENPDVYEWMPMGQYKIAEATTSFEGTTVKAYDVLANFDEFLPDNFMISGSLYSILTRVCNRCGAVLGMTQQEVEDLPNGTQPLGLYKPNDCQTYRDIIFWLSQLVGGWAESGRDGKFYLRTYPPTQTPVKTLTDTKLAVDCQFSSWVTSFGSIIFTNEDNSTSFYGSTGIGVSYLAGLNPFMIYGTTAVRDQMRGDVLDVLAAIVYQPFKVSLMSSPIYDLGDVIYFDGDIAGSDSYVGIVNSIEWSLNKGFVISGFGSNPNLQSVQSASQQAASAARSSSSDKETEYTRFENDNQINIGSTPVKAVDILFSANKPTVVEMWHEFQLETSPEEGKQLEIEATYYLDMVEIDRKPVETWDDTAKHLLDLHYMTRIRDAGSHQWQVYLTATNGTAVIRPNGVLAVLKGQGLAKEETWNGVIVLDDTVTAFDMLLGIVSFTENCVVHHAALDYREQLADTLAGLPMGVTPGGLTENLLVVLGYADWINFMGENYYMGTEGVLL